MNLLDIKGPKDFHMHTRYCDGANTAEEMIEAAISKGLKAVGISGHVFTAFDQSYCMSQADCQAYHDEVRALAAKYADKIQVLCGIEQELYSEYPTEMWDYVIGSAHYIRVPAAPAGAPREDFLNVKYGYQEYEGFAYIPVDESKDLLLAAAERYFGGDMYALVEAYFDGVSTIVEKTGCDLIGHFDLVCKVNGDGSLFDENHPRFVNAWKAAADKLLKSGVPFEINTGAISRGYRDDPYPLKPAREYIKEKGGKFIWSSDSHKISTICFGFEEKE